MSCKATVTRSDIAFASFIGADMIHKSNGDFVKMEHTDYSRNLCAHYRSMGTTAWVEFCRQDAKAKETE